MTTQTHRLEISGLPVYWADDPGPFAAALVFRVGVADESLPAYGLSHLVEHLALFPIGRTAFFANGVVEALWTGFYASGTRDEVLSFLASVAGNLGDLPLDRLEAEKRVLRTESASRAPGWREQLLDLRFGPRGFGLPSFEEFALRRASAADVTGWANERFVRGNAAVWMTSEPPDDFDLPLTEGNRIPAPAFEPRPRLEFPAHLAQGTGGVSLAMVGERSMGLVAGFGIAQRRAEERLRRESGLSYNVGAIYEPLDADHAHLALGADCMDEHAATVQGRLLELLRSLGEAGPTEDELAEAREGYRRAATDPGTVRGWLDYAVRDELLGSEVLTPQQVSERAEALNAGEAAEAISACLPQMILVSPTGSPRPSEFAQYGTVETEPRHGKRYAQPGLRLRTKTWVEVDEQGVTLYQPDGPVTVLFSECAAVLRWSDVRVTLLSIDGSWIELAGRQMRGGDDLLETVLAAVDASIVVPMDDTQTPGSLADLAAEKLGRSNVTKEFEALPEHLLPGERVENLSQVDTSLKTGLLALTDRRLVCIWRTTITRQRSVETVDLAEVESVDAARGRLALTKRDGSVFSVSGFAKPERALEFGETLRQRLAARS